MSDGIWENSKTMEKYWPFANVIKKNGERIFLEIIKTPFRPNTNMDTSNGFYDMDENMIKVFFAKKVKQIAKTELNDADIGEWKRDNLNQSTYLSSYDEDITIQDAYFVYEHLLGRSGFQKKYPQEVCDEFIGKGIYKENIMKKLNITKKQYGESKYFTNKYGTLKYVSESGNVYKTSKGHLLKFINEAKGSKYDGIENSWDKIKGVIESTSASIEEVAEKMKVIESITLDALDSRISAKKAASVARKAEAETKYIDNALKEVAEKMGGDSPMFFAVAQNGRRLGVLIDKVPKVTSQKDVRDATLATLTNPEINAQNEELNQLSNSIIAMLDKYEQKLVESGIINPEGTIDKTWKAAGIYDQDDDGKMHKIAEGKISDMARGAWNSIKSGANKIWGWVSNVFFPRFVSQEEKFSDLVQKFDDYLSKVEREIA